MNIFKSSQREAELDTREANIRAREEYLRKREADPPVVKVVFEDLTPAVYYVVAEKANPQTRFQALVKVSLELDEIREFLSDDRYVVYCRGGFISTDGKLFDRNYHYIRQGEEE